MRGCKPSSSSSRKPIRLPPALSQTGESACLHRLLGPNGSFQITALLGMPLTGALLSIVTFLQRCSGAAPRCHSLNSLPRFLMLSGVGVAMVSLAGNLEVFQE